MANDFFIQKGNHLVFKDPTCTKGQMRIHMHPDDYEEFVEGLKEDIH